MIKLTKTANINLNINGKMLGQHDSYLNQPFKTINKNTKNDIFILFEEFKLKYYRKSLKTTMFRYFGAGTVRLVSHDII